MTAAQSKRLESVLTRLQDLRRELDDESAKGMTGIGVNFGTALDLDEALWGVLYAEKALARIWEREATVRSLPPSTREQIRLRK